MSPHKGFWFTIARKGMGFFIYLEKGEYDKDGKTI